jgi:hypothetical protein
MLQEYVSGADGKPHRTGTALRATGLSRRGNRVITQKKNPESFARCRVLKPILPNAQIFFNSAHIHLRVFAANNGKLSVQIVYNKV